MIRKILSFIGRAFVIVCFICSGMLLIELFRKELQQNKNYKSYVGKQIVIDGDTTRIVKYSSGGYGIPGGFYLYNGAIVSPDVVEKFIIE